MMLMEFCSKILMLQIMHLQYVFIKETLVIEKIAQQILFL